MTDKCYWAIIGEGIKTQWFHCDLYKEWQEVEDYSGGPPPKFRYCPYCGVEFIEGYDWPYD